MIGGESPVIAAGAVDLGQSRLKLGCVKNPIDAFVVSHSGKIVNRSFVRLALRMHFSISVNQRRLVEDFVRFGTFAAVEIAGENDGCAGRAFGFFLE